MSIMIVQTKCKLNNAVSSLKLFYILSKEIQKRKYHTENKKNLKNGSYISPAYQC